MFDSVLAVLFWRRALSNHAVVPLLAASFLSALMTACAPAAVVQQKDRAPEPADTMFGASNKGWWKIYFHIRRDPSGEPDWHVDALLADQTLAPVVAPTEPGIELWRFHRRAALDAAGHRFSLLFYSDRETARTINNGISQSRAVKLLSEHGLLLKIGLAELSAPPDVAIEATSDATWPESIQRSWPWFIMGVSQSWLKLISEVKKTRPIKDDPTIEELIAYYRGLNDEVSALWREHGQHVYLHHLNALFGYQPLVIRETNLKRF